LGAIRTEGDVRNCLSSAKAVLASFDHSNFWFALRSLKNGRPLSPSRDMNQLRAAMHPVSFWMSLMHLGGFILITALIFWVRPYALTANYVAKQYARWHTKYALLGIQLPLKLIECLEGLVEVIDQGRGYFGLHHYVINICLNKMISDLVLEALLDGPLIGCACVFEPKQHGCVAVSTEGRDKGCLDLVLLS
jgi:hypothetical protein